MFSSPSLQSLPLEILTHISTYLNGKDLRTYVTLCRSTALTLRDLSISIPRSVTRDDVQKYFTMLGSCNVHSLTTLKISNVSQLSTMNILCTSGIKLTSLTVSWRDNDITDIYDIGLLTSLTSLDLPNCYNETNISTFTSLTNLTNLNLQSWKSIRDIRPLGSLTNLRSLNLSNCGNIRDFSILGSLTNIARLDLK